MTQKIRLLSTNLKSGSLRRIANGLSTRLGYKVWRSKHQKPNRIHLLYGDQKDKIHQYQWFKEHQIPALPFTTSQEEAKQWCHEEEKLLVARCLTRASEGRGIVLLEPESPWVVAPVYTQYRKKKREYRVHLFRDAVVHVLEKRKKVGFEGDTKIRNTANGYVFCSENVVEPEGLRELALAASKVTKSDFKGVDIGYNEKKKELFVIEVNSAPGIEGTNVNRYCDVIVQGL